MDEFYVIVCTNNADLMLRTGMLGLVFAPPHTHTHTADKSISITIYQNIDENYVISDLSQERNFVLQHWNLNYFEGKTKAKLRLTVLVE